MASRTDRCQKARPSCRVHVTLSRAGCCRRRKLRIVLLLGLINMMRGGSPNRSQKLMRACACLLQFVAIIVIMATIWVDGPLSRRRKRRQALTSSAPRAYTPLFSFGCLAFFFLAASSRRWRPWAE